MRPLTIPCLLLGLIAISGCDNPSGALDTALQDINKQTIKPFERLFEDDAKPAAAAPPATPEAAHTSALPVLRGEASEADTSRLVADLFAAADAGHAPSQNLLGMLHQRGRGFPRNPQDAAYWYKRAADQGLAVAQFNLGVLYRSGTGVARFKLIFFASVAAYSCDTNPRGTGAKSGSPSQ